jgi:hypothetical protein
MTEQSILPITVSVPLWGRIILGIGENSAYAAATRGDFPTLKIGGLRRVPVRLAARQIVGDDEAAIAELASRLTREALAPSLSEPPSAKKRKQRAA